MLSIISRMCPEEGRPGQGVRLRLILGVPRAVFCAGGTISRSRQRCCHILPYAWCFLVRRGILFVCSFWFLFPEPHRSRPDAYEVRPRRGFHARVPNGEGRRAGRLSCARRLPSSLPRSRVCLGPPPIFYSGCLFFFLLVPVLQEFFVCSGY